MDDERVSNMALQPDGGRVAVPEAVARRVWIAAGGCCTFCGTNLLIDEVTGQDIMHGQLAHIVGATKSAKSPRGAASDLPVPGRNQAENLMLICDDQHAVIDDKSMWDVYDEDTLKRLKRTREDLVRRVIGMMTDSRASTVVRVVGQVGGLPIDLSRRAVASALLERELFPDYALLASGDEYELDLRNLGGPDDDAGYWASAGSMVRRLGARLNGAVIAGDVTRVSVFGLARIPLLVELGNQLGEGMQVQLFPTRKTGAGGFGWSAEEEPATFQAKEVRAGTDATRIAVVVSVTGPVDIAGRLPDHIDDSWTVIEMRPLNQEPTAGLDRSQETIDNFRKTWAKLLSSLEDRSGLEMIDLFGAVPAALAITLGQSLIRGRHPALNVYDLGDDGHYLAALQVRRS